MSIFLDSVYVLIDFCHISYCYQTRRNSDFVLVSDLLKNRLWHRKTQKFYKKNEEKELNYFFKIEK